MLDQHGSAPRRREARARDEHSMQVMEYGLAIVAFAAAILLAVVH